MAGINQVGQNSNSIYSNKKPQQQNPLKSAQQSTSIFSSARGAVNETKSADSIFSSARGAVNEAKSADNIFRSAGDTFMSADSFNNRNNVSVKNFKNGNNTVIGYDDKLSGKRISTTVVTDSTFTTTTNLHDGTQSVHTYNRNTGETSDKIVKEQANKAE